MKFREFFSLRQILFSAFIIVLILVFAFLQSGKIVEVDFLEEKVEIVSSRYNLFIHYKDIASAELSDLPKEPGNEIKDAYGNDILVCGVWQNDTWGEYTICAYGGTTKCVVVHLTDGRIFVFSSADDSTTTELYAELLTHLPTE